MYPERGLLYAGHHFNDVMNDLLRNSPVDDIKIPEGILPDEILWQFPEDISPRTLEQCDRAQLTRIIVLLATELSSLQAKDRPAPSLTSAASIQTVKQAYHQG
jgi:hypothetical protein